MTMQTRALLAATIVTTLAPAGIARAQPSFTKAQVADRIRRVEDGVDEFRKYLERRGEDARERKDTAQKSGRTSRRGGDGGATTATTEARKEQGKERKDDLEDALDELNRSTNRLRRQFDPTPNYMETKVQVDRVVDDGRAVNQIMARGGRGSQADRLWAALRASINDLARCYNIAPMGI